MDCTPPGQVAPPAQSGASAQAYSTVLPWTVPDGTQPERVRRAKEGRLQEYGKGGTGHSLDDGPEAP